jgi:hypothetical protein
MDTIDDQGRAAAALEIKKAMRRGPTQQVGGVRLVKRLKSAAPRKTDFTDTIRRLADQVVTGMEKCGLKPVPLLKAMARGRYGGVGDCSTAAIRKVHAGGLQVETPDQEYLRKLSAPPQSWNASNDSTTADAGGSLGTQRQTAPGAKPARLGPAQADSITPRNALPTDDEDPTVKALKDIFSKAPHRGL